MLTLTENAATLIASFVRRIDKRTDAGIRISGAAPAGSRSMSVAYAPSPQPTDEVIEQGGARIFIDRHAADYLASKELDATLKDGTVDLTIRTRD